MQYMVESQTIVAPATPQGKSALAILRISGTEAFSVAAKCIVEKNIFLSAPNRTIRLYTLKDPDRKNIIDQITGIKYRAPKSFTGEDMVEIICHGGRIIIKEIFDSLINAGARPATGGEFTRRALLNGKIDVMKAEAIGALIDSNSETELLCAQKLYTGKAKELELWRKEIVELLEKIETRIEFEETDSIKDPQDNGKKLIEGFLQRMKMDLERREKIRVVENGIKVVIVGPVNAGKSTLFNTLIGKNRAIVHYEPGTTRDVVSERLWFHGHEIQLFDCAGFRKAHHEIEREGIERSREAMRNASVVIWVTAADEKIKSGELRELVSNAENTVTLCVINKIDKGNGKEKRASITKAGIKTISLSLKEEKKEATERLISYIVKKTDRIKRDAQLPDILFNARHEAIGRALIRTLSIARDEWERPEVAAIYLKKGLTFFEEYFGVVNSEEVLDKIFKNFCIGK
jgi:tRNA modification GTPase